MDDLLEEARREQHRELEREARKVIVLRARLPHLVQETIAQLLDEVDDLEHARELAGLDKRTENGDLGPMTSLPYTTEPVYPSGYLLALMFAMGWTLSQQPGAARYVDAIGTASRVGRIVVATMTVLEVAIRLAVMIVLLPIVLFVGAILIGWVL